MNRQEKARAKLERRALRGPGFSNYAERKLNQLIADKIEEDDLAECEAQEQGWGLGGEEGQVVTGVTGPTGDDDNKPMEDES